MTEQRRALCSVPKWKITLHWKVICDHVKGKISFMQICLELKVTRRCRCQFQCLRHLESMLKTVGLLSALSSRNTWTDVFYKHHFGMQLDGGIWRRRKLRNGTLFLGLWLLQTEDNIDHAPQNTHSIFCWSSPRLILGRNGGFKSTYGVNLDASANSCSNL